MIRYKIIRDDLDDLGQKVYDIVKKIIVNDDNGEAMFSFLLLMDDPAITKKMYKYLTSNKNLTQEDIMLEAIYYSQQLALFHKI